MCINAGLSAKVAISNQRLWDKVQLTRVQNEGYGTNPCTDAQIMLFTGIANMWLSHFKTLICPFQAKEHGGKFQNLVQMREIAVGRFVLDECCGIIPDILGRQNLSNQR